MLFDDVLKSGTLSQGDLAVVNYVKQHPHDVVHMSSRELGEATFVSPSTVVRLCKKAGFGSFANMKVALARELADEESYQAVDSDFPELEHASVDRVLATISSMEREAIRKTERLLAQVDWNSLLQAFEQAPSVTIYAIGSSRTACLGFAENLRRIGKRVTLASENYALAGQWAGSCPRDELSVLVSYNGQGTHVEHPARVLARRGLKSVSVSSEADDALCRLTTWHLSVALTERRFMNARMAPFQSSVATTYVLDTLFAELFARNYAAYSHVIARALDVQGTSLKLEPDDTVNMVLSAGPDRIR